MAGLAQVRRLEAAGFRAWPAAEIEYDGSWQLRLTADYPSKRLNSVNPLDPSDHHGIERRIDQAAKRFRSLGRPLVFRLSPLAPSTLEAHFDSLGWRRFDETVVMVADLAAMNLDPFIDQLPVRDRNRYADASLEVHGSSEKLKPGLMKLLDNIRPASGLFLAEDKDKKPLATALCVNDSDLAGIFQLAVRSDLRRTGKGRALLGSALRWARMHGARTAWIQVVADNKPAMALYGGFGYREIYRYAYREEPAQ